MTPEFRVGERVRNPILACGECGQKAKESTFPDTISFYNEETGREETHPICQTCLNDYRGAQELPDNYDFEGDDLLREEFQESPEI